MEKLKARKLRRLKAQKDGWEKAFQLISEKYKPSQKVEDIQRLLKDCGCVTASFTDRPIDAATADKLSAISKKCSIECKVQGKTTRRYYALAEEQLKRVSKEYDEFEINYKRRQKIRREKFLLVVGVTTVLLCGFISLGGAEWLLAEKYMHEGNYEAALEKYSQCGQLWNTSNKELEAKYQTAEAYLQNGDYEVALKWFTKCGNYKDTEDEVEEVKRKITEALLQPLGLKVNSPAEIYTLGNAIPCGLVKYPISYDTILSVNSGALVDETESALTCEDYFLYDCSCEIKYFFDSNKLLSKMEVVGPYMHDKEDFMDEAIRKIANKMQDELNVRPYIHQANTCSYKFIKDGVVYVMDSEEDNSRFRLTITAK